jgi:hypothetical protein
MKCEDCGCKTGSVVCMKCRWKRRRVKAGLSVTKPKRQNRRKCFDCHRLTTAIRCTNCRLAALHTKRERTPWFVERLGPNHRVLPFVMGLAEQSYDHDSD